MDLWKEFGVIRCIHMPSRKDRRAIVDKAVYNLRIPLTFYNPTPHPDGPIRGCYESHLAVMREAIAAGKDTCLIFEDDFEESNFSWEKLDEVCRFSRNNTEWDIIYLGCFPDVLNHGQSWFHGNMFRVRATQTHAYVVHKRFMLKAVEDEFCGMPIDEYFKAKASCFAILPSLFMQASTSSDVSSVSIVSMFPAKQAIVSAIENYTIDFGVSLRSIVCLFAFVCVALRLRKVFVKRTNGRS
jgi:hypothetical protein